MSEYFKITFLNYCSKVFFVKTEKKHNLNKSISKVFLSLKSIS